MKKSNFILIIFLLTSSIPYAQNKNDKLTFQPLSEEQYQVINDIFGSSKNYNVHLLSMTDYSKSWSFLMTPEILDKRLLGHCVESNEIVKWENIFSKEDWLNIYNKIRNLSPHKLDKSRLSKSINLYESITKKASAYKITSPIIVRDYAFIKHSSIDNEIIIIAKKVSGKWKQWCRKEVSLVYY